jgi:predicted dinucleotide-binding enzyme
MKIAILGSGAVGRALARLFVSAGHTVVFGGRGISDSSTLDGIQVVPSQQAATEGEIVVDLALPFGVLKDVLPTLAEALIGKVVVDATNPVQSDWSPLLLGQENSAGEEVQTKLLPRSKVVKAFNTIFADMTDVSKNQLSSSQRITAFVASDHADAKAVIVELARAAGFDPVDVGPLKAARHLEAVAHLNIQIAVNQKGGTNAAIVYAVPQRA